MLRMLLLQRLHRHQRIARSTQLLLYCADAHPRTKRCRHALTHGYPLRKGRGPLVKRMTKHRHDPDLVHRVRLQHVQTGQLMTDVRRVKAPSEKRDTHGPMVRLRDSVCNPGVYTPRQVASLLPRQRLGSDGKRCSTCNDWLPLRLA